MPKRASKKSSPWTWLFAIGLGVGFGAALALTARSPGDARRPVAQARASMPDRPTPSRASRLVHALLSLRLVLVLALVVGLVTATGRLAIADGEPGINFSSSPSSTTCGSAQNIEVVVNGSNRAPVANNTSITFTTSLGYIISPALTEGGAATASLVIPPKQSGTAEIRASGSGYNATKSITVTCAANPAPLFLPSTLAPAALRPPVTAQAPAPAAPAPPAVISLNLNMFEYGYSPSAFNVRVGQPVNLNLTNSGRLPHTFTLAGVTNSGPVAPGLSRTLQFTANQTGTFMFYCTIHGPNLMSGRITVTP
ncbi:MAG TPA: cupredoxin domain-containing protein [Dehalococcoidia bacterium]|nr:cupredoxin domain-containing protein [Dehalococcoidia bacterium]